MPERTIELSPEEQIFKIALKDIKIFSASEEQLKSLMLYIYALVGLRGENYPKGLDKEFIHTYIREYHGGHTIKEIRLAFTMAIQNKLGVDATTFESFTTAYFSRIMEAYRQWATKTIRLVSPKPIEKQVPRHEIETEYCYAKLKAMDKGPCKLFL